MFLMNKLTTCFMSKSNKMIMIRGYLLFLWQNISKQNITEFL